MKLQIAQLANELGQKEIALEMLNKIRNLEWSKTYYPDMPQYLTGMTLFVKNGEVQSQPMTSDKQGVEQSVELTHPAEDLSRRRALHSR